MLQVFEFLIRNSQFFLGIVKLDACFHQIARQLHHGGVEFVAPFRHIGIFTFQGFMLLTSLCKLGLKFFDFSPQVCLTLCFAAQRILQLLQFRDSAFWMNPYVPCPAHVTPELW